MAPYQPVDHVRHHRGRGPLNLEEAPRAAAGEGLAQDPRDHARQHRARQQVQTERDRLLKQADKRINKAHRPKFFGADSRDRARALLLGLGLSLGGITGYVIMIVLWFLVYHRSFVQTVSAFIIFIVISVLLCVGSSRRALGKDRAWLWWLGLLLGVSTMVGFVVGFFLYYHNLLYYWKYSEMRTYTNVAAAQDSNAFKDGALFLFTEDSRVDTLRAVGYKSKWTGETYCVAPVVDSSMANGDNIYYWAVGENCCGSRAAFFCDDAEDQSVRSALVVLNEKDVVRNFMSWVVSGSSYRFFKEAVKMEEASYATKAAEEPRYLYWTKDPIAMKDSFYTRARKTCTVITIVFYVAVFLFAYNVAWRLLPQRTKQAVIRQ